MSSPRETRSNSSPREWLPAREWLAARRAAATAETAAEACEVLRVCAVGLWLWLAEAFGAVRAAVAVSRS